MPNWDQCRRSAMECLELARLTSDIELKASLLTMGQEWLKMAYSRHVEHFETVIDGFNQRQMTGQDRGSSESRSDKRP